MCYCTAANPIPCCANCPLDKKLMRAQRTGKKVKIKSNDNAGVLEPLVRLLGELSILMERLGLEDFDFVYKDKFRFIATRDS